MTTGVVNYNVSLSGTTFRVTPTISPAVSTVWYTLTADGDSKSAVYNGSTTAATLLLDIPIPFGDDDPTKVNLSNSITAVSVLILVEVMLGLGCSVDFELLRKHIKKPIGVVVAGFTQFGLMPLIAFGLGKAVKLGPVAGLATIVTASVPGGVLSNVLAYLIKGDMSLSMLMTTASTILALGFLPLNLLIYGSHWLPEDSHLATLVPYSSIFLSFALMIGPALAGIFIKWKWAKAADIIKTVCKVLLVLSILAMIVLSALLYGTELLLHIPNELWLISVCLPTIGFSLGFILSSFGGLRGAARRTVSIETGCQNSHMSAAVLKVAFPSNIIGPYFLFPLIYGAIQFLEGSVLVIVTIVYMKFKDKKEANEKNDDKEQNEKSGNSSSESAPDQGRSLGKWISNLQVKWLSRKGGDDKAHILTADPQASTSRHIVANVAQDIADTASTD